MSKFVFFGTPYVARDTLALLVDAGFVPTLVVTSPDAPQGRGMHLAPSETKEWAEAHGLRVLSPEKLNAEAIAAINAYGCEYAVVVAYGKILPTTLIESFPKGVLNIHYSLLPAYRGASPVEAALLHNDDITGVSIQQMVHELDAGDVLAQEETKVSPTETTRELRARLITLGAQLLITTLPAFEAGTVVRTPQDPSKVTTAGKIPKSDGELTLGNDQENWNKYRAYAESPGTYFFMEKNGKRIRVKIKTARFENGQFIPDRIVPEGKKEMSYADFVR